MKEEEIGERKPFARRMYLRSFSQEHTIITQFYFYRDQFFFFFHHGNVCFLRFGRNTRKEKYFWCWKACFSSLFCCDVVCCIHHEWERHFGYFGLTEFLISLGFLMSSESRDGIWIEISWNRCDFSASRIRAKVKLSKLLPDGRQRAGHSRGLL